MGETVLVTGGLGLVGSHVSRALVGESLKPVIYDLRHDTELIPDVASACTIVNGGLEDLPRLISVIQEHRPVAILHFAALVGASVERYPWAALNTNLVSSAAVFEAARLCGVQRVVMASSKMVYGPVEHRHRHPNYEPVTETHPREPQDLYGKLKRATEDLAAHYAQLYGLDIVALRFASSFGPGGANRHKVLLMRVVEAAIQNTPFHVEAGAEQCDHFCYSAEAANATLSVLQSPVEKGRFRAYNISSEELFSLTQIISILGDLYPHWEGSAGPGLDYRGMGLGHYFSMDTTRARTELRYEPRFAFRSAVEDYARLLRLISPSGL